MATNSGPAGSGTPEARFEFEIRSNERQRIAREVHDSTSQLLVVLQLQLGQLKRVNSPGLKPIVQQCEAAIHEIRAVTRGLGID